jgi:hypothetical protein
MSHENTTTSGVLFPATVCMAMSHANATCAARKGGRTSIVIVSPYEGVMLWMEADSINTQKKNLFSEQRYPIKMQVDQLTRSGRRGRLRFFRSLEKNLFGLVSPLF